MTSTSNKTFVLIILIILNSQSFLSKAANRAANIRQIDSLKYMNDIHKFRYNKLILPAALITTGALGLVSPALQKMDLRTKEKIMYHQPTTTRMDDYTQYFPAVMVYGLNLAGVKGLHNLNDRSIIYISSQLIAAGIVNPAKKWIGKERPDGSNRKSFPSGHTATAFSNAHFMYREYRDYNTLLSLSGYPFAIFTGVYRTINNKHWVTDVIAGAGIGILSTELAYWLYPKISAVMNKKYDDKKRILIPYYQSRAFGLSYILLF
ncbi:phosphatase PAP2 family protein [Sphingobacterium kitahiroshimense]|uniref:Phosphatase PAP2 family protein n=1 Tax=Sphingobacterium kitahiroshimense TaxID=470446 RepID=A0ABV0C0Z5_9SPHI